MSFIANIILNIILPIFVLIAIGALVERFIHFDLATLSRLTLNVLIPALLVVKLMDSQLKPQLFPVIFGFGLLHFILLWLMSWFLYGQPPFKAQRPALMMGTMFYNTSIVGIPFVQLAFGDEFLGVYSMILLLNVFLNFSLGLWLVNSHVEWKLALRELVRSPMLYALAAGWILNAVGMRLPPTVRLPLDWLVGAVLPVSLLTLGAQLVRSKFGQKILPISMAVGARLIISPLLAGMLALGFKTLLPGSIAGIESLLVLATGLPAALNVFILFSGRDKLDVLTSQIVFWSTLLSAVTLTALLVIYR
jgi:predicted permease